MSRAVKRLVGQLDLVMGELEGVAGGVEAPELALVAAGRRMLQECQRAMSE